MRPLLYYLSHLLLFHDSLSNLLVSPPLQLFLNSPLVSLGYLYFLSVIFFPFLLFLEPRFL